MKQGTTTFEGKEYKYVYPEGLENDLLNQMPEVLGNEVYKLGRRKKDAVYLDLGANIGNASRYFYPYAQKIYALEPNPHLYEALVENTKDLPNIKTFNLAVGHNNGFDYMYSNEGSSVAQTFFGNNKSLNAVRVNIVTLEEFMKQNKIDHVDVMKIDIEESEYILFPSESFSRVADKIDFIIGEAHFSSTGGFPDVIPEMLKEYGFETKFLHFDTPNYTRTFLFKDTITGKKREYKVGYDTVFVAERK